MRRLLLATALASAAALAAPGDGLAATGCPKVSAKLISGTVTDFNQGQPEGGPLAGSRLKYPGHFFRAETDLTFKVYGNRAKVAADSVFKFDCYAASRTAPKWPSVLLLTGDVTVSAAARKPLGVVSNEGLFDTRAKKMRYRVSRETTQSELDMDDFMAWFANFRGQPKGTTEIESLTRGATVGVTPYVGKDPGRCRYSKSATLSSDPANRGSKFVLG